ncbi:MAG: hypothetical protein R3B70_28480 [Polyangiaceae bacterium]
MQEAQDLFARGREQARSGDCQQAIPLFEASQEAYPSRGALYNLALCEEKVGRSGRAWEHFRDLLPQLDPEDDRLSETRAKMAALELSIGRIEIGLAPDAPPGVTVTLGGVDLAPERFGTVIPLEPGTHHLLVRAAGREDRRHDVVIEGGERQTVTLEVGPPITNTAPLASAAPPPPRVEAPKPLAPPPPRPDTTIPLAPALISWGIGLSGLGVMSVTGVLAMEKKGELQRTCPDPARCSASGLALAREGEALTTASTAAAAVWLAGLGAGTTLFFLSKRRSTTARVGPVVWASGGGAVFEGRF